MNKQYHHRNLKNELMENAIKIISDSGVDALSLRALSKKCGVSHNAIYRHYDSKETMIECCRNYVSAKLTEYLSEKIHGMDSRDPQTIYTLSHSYIDYFIANPTYFSFIYQHKANCRIVFSLESVPDNYPPFELFRKLCVELIKQYKLTPEEGLRRLVRYWSLMQGAVSLMISPNVELDGSWDDCLKDIFLIGGKKDE